MNSWDERYRQEGYAYGTEPNEFLAERFRLIPPGPVLCLADGEGRNGVFLASQGYDVTSVDYSSVGIEKAKRLAAGRGCELNTIVADLAEFDLGIESWNGIVSIFAHVPVAARTRAHSQVARALRAGGVFVLEAYTTRQLEIGGRGGPKAPDLLMSAEGLRRELVGLHIESAVELVREVNEGPFHRGLGGVVQVIGTKQ